MSDGNQIETRILDCVKRATEVYGTAVLDVLLWDFDRRAGLSIREIASNPDEFVQTLREVLGSASSIVENRITAQICKDFHLDVSKVAGLEQAIRIASSAHLVAKKSSK